MMDVTTLPNYPVSYRRFARYAVMHMHRSGNIIRWTNVCNCPIAQYITSMSNNKNKCVVVHRGYITIDDQTYRTPKWVHWFIQEIDSNASIKYEENQWIAELSRQRLLSIVHRVPSHLWDRKR